MSFHLYCIVYEPSCFKVGSEYVYIEYEESNPIITYLGNVSEFTLPSNDFVYMEDVSLSFKKDDIETTHNVSRRFEYYEIISKVSPIDTDNEESVEVIENFFVLANIAMSSYKVAFDIIHSEDISSLIDNIKTNCVSKALDDYTKARSYVSCLENHISAYDVRSIYNGLSVLNFKIKDLCDIVNIIIE
jgi:hypothetical protein